MSLVQFGDMPALIDQQLRFVDDNRLVVWGYARGRLTCMALDVEGGASRRLAIPSGSPAT